MQPRPRRSAKEPTANTRPGQRYEAGEISQGVVIRPKCHVLFAKIYILSKDISGVLFHLKGADLVGLTLVNQSTRGGSLFSALLWGVLFKVH